MTEDVSERYLDLIYKIMCCIRSKEGIVHGNLWIDLFQHLHIKNIL